MTPLHEEIFRDFENLFAVYVDNPQFKEEMTEYVKILSPKSEALKYFLSQALTRVREETIEECLRALPEERHSSQKDNMGNDMPVDSDFMNYGYNSALHQAREAIKRLK